MNEKAFLSKVSKLVDSVRHQGMPERAKQLEAIVEDRIIWAQMAFRLRDELRAWEWAPLAGDAPRLADEILAELEEYTCIPHDAEVYEPMRRLATRLAELGLQEWEVRLLEDMACGATGTEIYMGLRWHLEKLLPLVRGLPVEHEARRLHRLLDNALREATVRPEVSRPRVVPSARPRGFSMRGR